MNKYQILGIVRHVLTAGGAILAIKGYIDEVTATLIVGSLMTSISGIWSIFDKSDSNIVAKAESILERRIGNK